MNRRVILTGLAGLATASCGYHVAGKAVLIPKDVQTIGIPPFVNNTTRYRLTERLPSAITKEFLARTKYQILPVEQGADAVLTGIVSNVVAFPTIFDPNTGRAAGVQVQAVLSVKLRIVKTNTLVYDNGTLDFRQRYEISSDPKAYFDESTPAFDRLCRDVANSVVTGILENF